jgi:chromate transport protein ChrA
MRETRLFKYENLWDKNLGELMKLRVKAIQDAKISWVNSLVAAVASVALFSFEFQHLSIIVLLCSVVFILSYIEDGRKISQIDCIHYVKKQYEETHVW